MVASHFILENVTSLKDTANDFLWWQSILVLEFRNKRELFNIKTRAKLLLVSCFCSGEKQPKLNRIVQIQLHFYRRWSKIVLNCGQLNFSNESFVGNFTVYLVFPTKPKSSKSFGFLSSSFIFLSTKLLIFPIVILRHWKLDKN